MAHHVFVRYSMLHIIHIWGLWGGQQAQAQPRRNRQAESELHINHPFLSLILPREKLFLHTTSSSTEHGSAVMDVSRVFIVDPFLKYMLNTLF